jgi:hypothetical protein
VWLSIAAWLCSASLYPLSLLPYRAVTCDHGAVPIRAELGWIETGVFWQRGVVRSGGKAMVIHDDLTHKVAKGSRQQTAKTLAA